MRACAICLAVACGAAALAVPSVAAAQPELVRLHVVANSDSDLDQLVKLVVRDAVAAVAQPLLAGSRGVGEAVSLLEAAVPLLNTAADSVLAARGLGYRSHVAVGRWPFPARGYGQDYCPAGDYQTVRIILGDGAGANWWCVVFPPLCFRDLTEGPSPGGQRTPALKLLEWWRRLFGRRA
ncbi:MAG: stage II sporulation protein R [Bacillota bacterium]